MLRTKKEEEEIYKLSKIIKLLLTTGVILKVLKLRLLFKITMPLGICRSECKSLQISLRKVQGI